MVFVKIKNLNKTIECEKNTSLARALLDNEIFVDNACNGNGTCGKCKVKILSDIDEVMTETERKLLTDIEIKDDVRLSCLIDVKEDMIIETIQKEKNHSVLTEGYLPEFERDVFETGYGLIIDIGTTTLASGLIDLKTGEEIASSSMINSQKQFGLDVLTRISYEYEFGEEGIKKLQETIVGSINYMIADIEKKSNIDINEILEITVAANCIMTHMLLGIDARGLGKFPYEPVFKSSKRLLASEIGIEAGENTILYCLPQVSAFIGSDVVAGVYVSELEKENKNVLFIDIGTNGEIVLSKSGRLISCSCAAGPALEGMNITAGMRAEEGAIEDIEIKREGIALKTIGDKDPVGICGSGILAAIKELLRTGIIKDKGVFIKKDSLDIEDYRYKYIRLNEKKREFILNENPELIITQKDIRQVQLAKGAILSGFIALLNTVEISMGDLDKVLVAGQFGAHLSPEFLVGTGILPMEVKNKIEYIGNSSKSGAYMALMSTKAKEEIEEIAKDMEYVELAVLEDYEKIFRDSMVFPSYDKDGKNL